MTDLDKLFRDANDDLRTGLRNVEVPAFTPAPRRAPMVVAALALVLAIGIGGVLANRDTTPAPDELVVTTQPDVSEPSVATQPDAVTEPDDTGQPDEADVDPATTDAADMPGDDLVEFGPGEVRQLTTAESGEFIVPLPLASAWNADETHLLVYRTGVNGGAHLIIEAATGVTVATPDINPPDIEQVWWHPLDADALIYLDGTDLVTWSLASESRSVVRSFSECDDADSGPSPSPPSPSGHLAFLCHRGTSPFESSEPYVVSVDGLTVHAGSGWLLNSAPRLSLDGKFVLISDDDGNVTPFDRDTFEMVDVQQERVDGATGISLENDEFIVVRLADGTEAAAAAQFRGDVFGNLVVHPLDGSAPSVILDEDAAGGFPASGTMLHANGAQGASTVVVSISNRSADSPLAGKLMVFDLAELDPANPASLEPIFAIDHASTGQHDYWSSVFVSVSPSGRFVTWSSDQGSDRVDTFIVELPS